MARFNQKASVGWVRGMDDMRKVLRSVTPEACAEMLEPAVSAALDPMLIAAKRFARRSRDTGALEASLVKKTKAYKNTGTVVGLVGPDRAYYLKGKKAGKLGRLQGSARKPANYAHLVEFGHQVAKGGTLQDKYELKLEGTGRYSKSTGKELKRWKKGAVTQAATGKSVGFVAPKPFLRPAVITTKAQQAAAFEGGLKTSMARHFNKHAKAGRIAA